MATVVFVHGTGVRKDSYDASFKLVAGALSASDVQVEPCFWGGELGAKLFLGGASVPDFDRTRAIEAESASEQDFDVALWAMLYDNPAAELQLLALRYTSEAEFVPGSLGAGEELAQRFRDLDIDRPALPADQAEELRKLLAEAELGAEVTAAQARLLEAPSFAEAIARAKEPLGEYRYALARALFAAALVNAWDHGTLPDGMVMLDGAARDRLVELVAGALGDAERAWGEWIKEYAGRLVASAGTRWFARRRGRLSEAAAPFGADVLAYQGRPAPIRSYIRHTLQTASAAAKLRGGDGGLLVLAHSLGGIACVDMLIEEAHPAVRALITVGSQAPLLYELDALTSQPLPRGTDGRPTGKAGTLPCHFPRWLNIYDPRDFLGYRAEPVFGADRVRDVVVDNRQPFPASHGAYWKNKAVWAAVAELLREVSE